MLSSLLYIGLPNGFFPSGFSTKSLCKILSFSHACHLGVSSSTFCILSSQYLFKLVSVAARYKA
jgi:hypothetical protein